MMMNKIHGIATDCQNLEVVIFTVRDVSDACWKITSVEFPIFNSSIHFQKNVVVPDKITS
jgi:hypothetical protein